MVAFGLMAGVVTALVITRWLGSLISGLLFGLSPADWITVVIAALLLMVVAVVACLESQPTVPSASIRSWSFGVSEDEEC